MGQIEIDFKLFADLRLLSVRPKKDIGIKLSELPGQRKV